MEPRRELVERNVRDELARSIGTPPERLRSLGSGQDFFAFVVDDLVIRVPRTPRAARKLVAERDLLAAIAPAFGALVPRPQAVVRSGAALPPPLFAYAWIEGEPLARATPAGRAAAIAGLAPFVRRLHAIASAPVEVDARFSSVVARLQRVVRERLLPTVAYSVAERRALEILSAREPPSGADARCLIHGDLSARNILVGPDGTLAGIVDWSDSAITDPAIDFAAVAYWGGTPALDAVLAGAGHDPRGPIHARAVLLGALLAGVELRDALAADDEPGAETARHALASLAPIA